jgi:hypothetical protein
MNRLALCALSLCLVMSSADTTGAAPIRWTLEGVAFGPCWAQYVNRAPLVPCVSGGTAAGWFVFDAATQVVSDWSISVSGGDETVFPPFAWAPSADDEALLPYADVINFSGDAAPAGLPWASRPRQIRLDLATPLPDAYGTVLIDPSSVIGEDLGAECFACLPFRFIVSGAVTSTPPAAVPEPSTLLLLASGLAVALRTTRRRRR